MKDSAFTNCCKPPSFFAGLFSSAIPTQTLPPQPGHEPPPRYTEVSRCSTESHDIRLRAHSTTQASRHLPQFDSDFEQNLFQQRLEKLEQIRAVVLRTDPSLKPAEAIYPNRFPAADEPLQLSHIPHLLARYDTPSAPVTAEDLEAEHPQVAAAGRLMSLRVQGKAGFAHLQQGGKRLQIYVRKDDVGEDVFALY